MSQIDQSIPVVIITGGNRGIGLGFTKNVLANTHPLNDVPENSYVIATTRDVASSPDLLELQKQYPERLHILPLDQTSTESINNFVTLFKEKGFTRIDYLINNAGVHIADKDQVLSTLDQDVYTKTHLTNAVGPILFTQALLDILNHTHTLKGGDLKGGEVGKEVTLGDENSKDDITKVRVIFISSVMGSVGEDLGQYACFMPIYRSSKAALNVLATIFAKDHPHLAVLLATPGWVATRLGTENANLTVDTSIELCVKVFNDHAYVTQSALKLWSHENTPYQW